MGIKINGLYRLYFGQNWWRKNQKIILSIENKDRFSNIYVVNFWSAISRNR